MCFGLRWMGLAIVLLIGILAWEITTRHEKLLYKGDFNLAERIQSLEEQAPSAFQTQVPVQPTDSSALDMPTAPPPENPLEPVFFSPPIIVEDGRQNFAVTLNAPVDNSWIGVEGALVSETTGTVELFEVASSYYHGSDSDGAWTEGSSTETVYLSAVPPGTYVLRIAPQWDKTIPMVPSFNLEVRSGSVRWVYPFLTFLGILLVPVLAYFRTLAFENRRWQESMFAPSSGDD